MRCLNCRQDGVTHTTIVCSKCGVHLPSLLRDVLPANTELSGGKRGSYRVDYPLGRGGFGVTYRAIHTSTDKIVAIKEFYPQEYAHRDGKNGHLRVAKSQHEPFNRAIARFLREGNILLSLQHTGVVEAEEIFEERGSAYLVMELVLGQTLRDELDAQPDKRMPQKRVRALVGQLVDALEVVHQRNVFHLDLKPDNILITPQGRVVLIDFGAARLGFQSRSTQAFTLDYVAPEVVARHDVGPQADLFELGMVVHEMLTGEVPPSALSRFLLDDWVPLPMTGEWAHCIAFALKMRNEDRPKTVREWWDLTPGRFNDMSVNQNLCKDVQQNPSFEDLEAGLSNGEAITAFMDGCNRRDTLFAPEPWVNSRLDVFRRHLSPVISAEQAFALREVVLKKRTIEEILSWLESGQSWQKYQDHLQCEKKRKDLEAAWRQEQEAAAKRALVQDFLLSVTPYPWRTITSHNVLELGSALGHG